MKQPLVAGIACSVVLSILAGCATQPAPGMSGRWKPVNRFDAAPQAIPLHPAYEFYASPLDRTLKTMLARWALDSKMALDYEAGSDFTLYVPVSGIRSSDLRVATTALTRLYAAEHVVIGVEADSIVVRPVPLPISAAGATVVAPAPAQAATEVVGP